MIPESAATSRADLLRAALDHAARGWPVFPCQPGGKRPLIRDWSNRATTDEGQIRAWWERLFPGANIGVPTGGRSGILALDVDQPTGLEALEAEHGKLPATRTHSTGSAAGGMHYLYRYPGQAKIRNSAGKLAHGLDVRGEGGYIVAPPSATTRRYEVLDPLPLTETPAGLLEALRRPQSAPQGRSHGTAGADNPRNPGPIEVGRRNQELFLAALDRKDDSREHGEVLADVLSINETCCEEPLPVSEVERVVASAMRYPVRPRSRKTPPEVLAIVGALERLWWATAWRGVGGKTERDVLRVLIALAKRYGEMIPAGTRVSVSVRTLALAAATHYTTVIKVLRRLRERGLLRKDDGHRTGTESGAVVLFDPRQGATTPQHGDAAGAAMPESGSALSRPEASPVADLRTPCFRWRGHVGKGRAGVLYALEAFGPQMPEELAERLGWSRERDLRRKYLDPLEARGLIERIGDRYGLPEAEAYVGAVEAVRGATVERKVRRTSAEGRVVVVVVDGASEKDREASDREKHEEQRRERERERRRYRRRLRLVPVLNPDQDRGPSEATVQEEPPAGEIGELERVEIALSDGDRLTLEAIEAFERKHGRGSFGWDRAGCKALFYSGPISGFWPEPDELRRIREYLDLWAAA